MAARNKWQAASLAGLILFPILLYFIFRYSTTAVFDKIPYQYSLSSEGDTLFHTLPDFSLIDQDGNSFTRQSTEGQVYLINFINTRDRKFTPLVIDNMRKVYENVRETNLVHVLSISTNPDEDSISVLKALSDSLGVDTKIWTFAMGERSQVLALGLENFKMKEFMGEQRKSGPFVGRACALVDKEGKVRKYYDATHLYDVEKVLMEDLRALLTLEYRDNFQPKGE